MSKRTYEDILDTDEGITEDNNSSDKLTDIAENDSTGCSTSEEVNDLNKNNKYEEKCFKCSVCLKEFVQKSSLTRHNQTHLKEKPWICDFKNCGKRFKLKEYLEAHKRSHYKSAYETLSTTTATTTAAAANSSVCLNTMLLNELQVSLLRSSATYHEQLLRLEHREQQLMNALQECSVALDKSVHLLKECVGVANIPLDLMVIAKKFSQI